MSLSSPSMLMGARCDSCVAWICMTRKRSRCPAAREEPDLSLIFHPNAEVLTQNRAVCVFSRLDVRHSSASQLRNSPVRSILLMVMLPAVRISFTFCGHYYFQMIGPILFRPDVQTPRANSTAISISDVIWQLVHQLADLSWVFSHMIYDHTPIFESLC